MKNALARKQFKVELSSGFTLEGSWPLEIDSDGVTDALYVLEGLRKALEREKVT